MRRPDELLDHAECEQLLGLLTARFAELKFVCLIDKSMRERSLADARLAGQEDEAGMSGACVRRLRQQAGQLVLPPDEHALGSARVHKV